MVSFFYAGHGLQHNGVNYILPVNIDIPSENYLGERAVSVQALLRELTDAENELNIIVLDACRDNPFTLNRGCSRGFAPIKNTTPGSIIVYATSINGVAEDGTGRNGLFTAKLLPNLRLPGLEVLDVFIRTNKDVIKASHDKQHPEISLLYFEPAYLGVMPVNASEHIKAKIHFDRGEEYNRYEDYDSAIVEFTEAIMIDPIYTAAYNNRGLAYVEKKYFDKAIADFDQAIKLNPFLAEAYSNRGTAYKIIGDYDRAIADLNQAIRLKPDEEEGYSNRGDTYYRKGDYDRAIMDLDQAIQLNPRLSGAYNNRSNAYRDKGDYDKAISDLKKAIQLNPKSHEAYNNLGNVYINMGNYNIAITYYNHAILINNPILTDLYYNRGLAYAKKGDYDKAIMDYEAVLRIDPNDIQARNNLDQAQRAQGN
jgi:tetratricopeptide (TPR) repeat protein